MDDREPATTEITNMIEDRQILGDACTVRKPAISRKHVDMEDLSRAIGVIIQDTKLNFVDNRDSAMKGRQ